jgi:hypothetical protein
LHDVFGAQVLRPREKFGTTIGINDNLRFAIAIADIEKDRAAVIAGGIDPAADSNFLADMFRPQLATGMSA